VAEVGLPDPGLRPSGHRPEGTGVAHGGRASRLGGPLRTPAALSEPAPAPRVPAGRGPGWLIGRRRPGPGLAGRIQRRRCQRRNARRPSIRQPISTTVTKRPRSLPASCDPLVRWPMLGGIVSQRPGGATEHAVVVPWIRQRRAATRWPAASADGGPVVRPGPSRVRASCWQARPGKVSPGTPSTAKTWTSPNKERPRPTGVAGQQLVQHGAVRLRHDRM
jgi:hypothetical protein